MFQTSNEIHELAKALSLAQKAYKPIGKDKRADTGKYAYRYADYATVLDAVRPALNENGIAVVQAAEASGNVVTVTTRLLHVSGQWMESSLSAVAESAAPQKLGSCITYARRYGFLSMVGAIPEDEDDDGKRAGFVQPDDSPPPDDEPPPFPVAAAAQAGDAMRKALGRRPKLEPAARKANALNYLIKRFGEGSYRAALARVIGRTFPDGEEIKITAAELEKIEAFIIVEEASDMEKP